MDAQQELAGKTALVTGGTKGIGLAVVQRLAAAGAYVFVTGRTQSDLDAAVASIGERGTGIRGDASDLDDLDAVFNAIRDSGRRLDVLHINAGGGGFAGLHELTVEDFDATFARNVRGATFTLQKALPLLNDGASVILTGSSTADTAAPNFGVYAATKAAIRSLTRTWAIELAPRRIRVNNVVPGPTETPGLRGLAPNEKAAEVLLNNFNQNIPLGRLVQPAEVAEAVLFLASDRSFTTGSELFVDGGEAHA
ncbi:SDR family NAD(P)-dependent oxidoreductase [Leifsonia virtsii]|uniref:SDR family oxidoreductase n=1 Tax=Leifsonia virtsii TaxID=3035915 RepID=A0ABT8J2Y7_9MICO|nr:SDR family oxidoreductase [Leifsonia virtsii]MDN4598952.1 SDR family oxidoreductase [Leifsonia virtsii]